jgi:hypothetical protein
VDYGDDVITRYGKVVVWGLKSADNTDLHHINSHFYEAVLKLGGQAVFVDDAPENRALVCPGDLVIAMDVAYKHLPVVPKAYYVLHNIGGEWSHQLDQKYRLNIQVYTDACAHYEKWREAVHWDAAAQVLYSPWGTDLFPNEFLEPIFNDQSHHIFFVGSVWNNELGHGNVRTIEKLVSYLERIGLKFTVIRHVPDAENVRYVRESRIAPAIAGEWQVENNYLPCRLFKSVSYGQLGITNVMKFRDILSPAFVEGQNFEEVIETALSMGPSEYRRYTYMQQSLIRPYNYGQKLQDIMQAFELVS